MRFQEFNNLKEGGVLLCKRTWYEGDFHNEGDIKNKRKKDLRWIKEKKYHIHQLNEYINDFGQEMRCYLLECEPFFLGRLRNEVFIYDDSVIKMFYSKKELRRIKIDTLYEKTH